MLIGECVCVGCFVKCYGDLQELRILPHSCPTRRSADRAGATCMAPATAFTELVEPWLAGTRFSKRDLALGIAVLPGVALVVGGVPDEMRIGIAVGALS